MIGWIYSGGCGSTVVTKGGQQFLARDRGAKTPLDAPDAEANATRAFSTSITMNFIFGLAKKDEK